MDEIERDFLRILPVLISNIKVPSLEMKVFFSVGNLINYVDNLINPQYFLSNNFACVIGTCQKRTVMIYTKDYKNISVRKSRKSIKYEVNKIKLKILNNLI